MIDLSSLIRPERVVRFRAPDKESALKRVCQAVGASVEITDPPAFEKAILAREKLLSTGVGLGFAVPHAKIDSVGAFVLGVGVLEEPIEFDSLDGKPVNVIVMIGGPADQQETYLRILAQVTTALKDAERRRALLAAKTPEEIIALFSS